ncbi:YceD family protein [Sulfitobacter aestuarii]|uniref:YceD family protein n=1 Tax=Sulfitobacter aestuarii TaxID=2161676 RepID=A0ABW5TZ08_9RHOB
MTEKTPRTPPSPHALRVAELSQTGDNAFALRPDTDSCAQIAAELDLSALRKLSFIGRVMPLGGQDWTLEGRLGATLVQPCVVTLEPVTTRIDVDVTRRYIKGYELPDEAEMEMPEDDSSEPLGQWIDPAAVMIEALALEVPEYPRKDAAELGQMVYTKPGEAPMTDEQARPFAGLAGLKNQLKPKKD